MISPTTPRIFDLYRRTHDGAMLTVVRITQSGFVQLKFPASRGGRSVWASPRAMAEEYERIDSPGLPEPRGGQRVGL